MVKKQKTFTKALSVALLATILLSQLFPLSMAAAAQITTRSLTLQEGSTGDGGSKIGGVVKHDFKFTVPNAGNGDVLSIKFEYCTLAAGTCVTPTGLSTTASTITDQQGAIGFTLVNTNNGAPYLTRATGTVTGGTALTYQLSDVTNPTTVINPPTIPNQTFFVRISTYNVADPNAGSPTPVDTGTVAASTNRGIDLSGTMPESLVFCTGKIISLTVGVPDCSTVTTGAVDFNQLFSSTDTATATSQMSASTNAGFGYNITVNGPTLTSGSNTITGMAAQTTGAHGVSQFGLNLKLNTTLTSTIAVGSEIAVASNGTNYRGQALTGYDTVDNFKFLTGDSVADSGFNTPGGSDAQIFTVSYIVNVPGSQPAGTYTTTITYICTPKF